MPYRYLDDIATADVAFAAWGHSREELVAAAADALLNVMVEDLSTVRPVKTLSVEIHDAEFDLLLFAFLQELIYYKDARQLLLRAGLIRISPGDEGLLLKASVSGERIDPDRHRLGVDVKAVTLHRFRVAPTTDGWEALVILDV